MPVLFRHRGYRLFFYSFEGSPREPAHVHCRKGNTEVKFWLRPFVTIAYDRGVPARDMRELIAFVQLHRNELERAGMSSFSPRAVRVDEDSFWVDVEDGRTIGVPLAWFPRLLNATPEARLDFELSPLGIHWDALDEDVLVEALFLGFGDQTRRRPVAA